MLNFFNYIRDFIESVGTFAVSLITGFKTILKALPSTLNLFTNSIGYLPNVLAVFATLTITISIIYLILNRDTGG